MKLASDKKITIEHIGKITLQNLREAFELPVDAAISIQVPSGGDYSGDILGIGSVWIPHLIVSWKETK